MKLILFIVFVVSAATRFHQPNPLIGKWQVIKLEGGFVYGDYEFNPLDSKKYFANFVNDSLMVEEGNGDPVERSYQVINDTIKAKDRGVMVFKIRKDSLFLSSLKGTSHPYKAIWVRVKTN